MDVCGNAVEVLWRCDGAVEDAGEMCGSGVEAALEGAVQGCCGGVEAAMEVQSMLWWCGDLFGGEEVL